MEISESAKDKENLELIDNDAFYDQPCRLNCPTCLKEVVTYMNEEYNYYAWIGTIIIFFVYGVLIGLPLIIFYLAICKNKTHSCTLCMKILYVKRFSPLSFKGRFVELKFDKCVIILRQLYIYIILALLLFAAITLNAYSLLFYHPGNLSSEENNNSLIDTYVNKITLPNEKVISWEDLINNCGSKVIIDNAARAQEIFERKFHGRVVTWKGHYIGAVINYSSPFDYNPDHVINYYIRMIPSESMHGADIILSISHKISLKYRNLQFNKGDPIAFTATLKNLGNEWKPYHLHALEIQKIDEFIDYEQKVMLFKGVTFDIEGQRKHKSNENNSIPNNHGIIPQNQNQNDNNNNNPKANNISNENNKNKENNNQNSEKIDESNLKTDSNKNNINDIKENSKTDNI